MPKPKPNHTLTLTKPLSTYDSSLANYNKAMAPLWVTKYGHQATLRLLELRELGLSASKIAAKLSQEFDLTITKGSVIGRLHRLKSKPNLTAMLERRSKALTLPQP